MAPGVFVPRVRFGGKLQAQAGHQVVVIVVRWAAWVLRVIGNFSAFLFAVDRFDGRVGIEYPRRIQQERNAFIDLPIQPVDPRFRRDRLQCPAQGVFGDDAVHAEKPRIDAIAPNGGDVGIALMGGED